MYIQIHITNNAQSIVHHSPTDALLAPGQQKRCLMNSHPKFSFCMMPYGTQYATGQFVGYPDSAPSQFLIHPHWIYSLDRQ